MIRGSDSHQTPISKQSMCGVVCLKITLLLSWIVVIIIGSVAVGIGIRVLVNTIIEICAVCSLIDFCCPSEVAEFADSVGVDELEVVGRNVACHEHEFLVALASESVIMPYLVRKSSWLVITLNYSVGSAVFQENYTSVRLVASAVYNIE